MKEEKCKTLVIDAELCPGQIRNIEKAIQGKVRERNQFTLRPSVVYRVGFPKRNKKREI